MGRTAESYLREAEARPLAVFYDYVEWDDMRLMDEAAQAHEYRDSMPHAPARLEQLNREIAHLVFEIEYRSGVYRDQS